MGFERAAPGDVDRLLHRLALDRSKSGQGLGKALMECAEAEAGGCGIPRIRLGCAAENAFLRSFYASLGYRLLGGQRHAEYSMDLALFEKRL